MSHGRAYICSATQPVHPSRPPKVTELVAVHRGEPTVPTGVEALGAVVAESERRLALVALVVPADRAVRDQTVTPATPGWGLCVPHATP